MLGPKTVDGWKKYTLRVYTLQRLSEFPPGFQVFFLHFSGGNFFERKCLVVRHSCKSTENERMCPKNQWLGDVFPIEIVINSPFFGDKLVFRGVSRW